jgi:renalase
MKIAIIGAGMAGLSAANRLREAGADCTVFEKSRGLGGRMATRRIGSLQFDHGAQYFTARGMRFHSRVERWLAEGSVAEWLPGKWVGTPGMTAPARSLARGLRVIRECRVIGLAGEPGCWQIVSDPGPEKVIDQECFDAVIMAIPAPQIETLAASIAIRFNELERVRYAPCLTLMLAFDPPTGLRAPSFVPSQGPVAWLARNDSKPARADGPETWVAHATPAWSRAHLDDSAETAADALLAAVRPWLGDAEPAFRMVHRWLYARVERTAGAPFLWDPAQQVGACGDWAGGPRVECAFDSGEALAAAIIEGSPAPPTTATTLRS